LIVMFINCWRLRVSVCGVCGCQSIMGNESRTGRHNVGNLITKPVTNEPQFDYQKQLKAQRAPQMVNFLRKAAKLELLWAEMVNGPTKIAVHQRV
jgi:hypothetical protein